MAQNRSGKSGKAVVVGALLILLAGIGVGWYFWGRTKTDTITASEVVENIGDFVEENIVGSEAEVEHVSSSLNLEEVIRIDEIHTLEYRYNSICEVKEDDKDKIAYYVAYEGTVILGIDAKGCEINIDPDATVINIVIPNVKVISTSVNQDTLDYIFLNEKYNTPSTGTRAQSYCLKDLKEKVKNVPIMMDMARESTLNEIEAMFGPIVEQYFKDYKLNVKFDNTQGGK